MAAKTADERSTDYIYQAYKTHTRTYNHPMISIATDIGVGSYADDWAVVLA